MPVLLTAKKYALLWATSRSLTLISSHAGFRTQCSLCCFDESFSTHQNERRGLESKTPRWLVAAYAVAGVHLHSRFRIHPNYYVGFYCLPFVVTARHRIATKSLIGRLGTRSTLPSRASGPDPQPQPKVGATPGAMTRMRRVPVAGLFLIRDHERSKDLG